MRTHIENGSLKTLCGLDRFYNGRIRHWVGDCPTCEKCLVIRANGEKQAELILDAMGAEKTSYPCEDVGVIGGCP